MSQSVYRRFEMASVSPDANALVTVHNIPVLEVGVEYPAASGPMTVTPDDLQSIVASQEDPNIKPPRIKLGHVEDGESLVNDDLQALFEQVYDGRDDGSDPSIGTWQNLYVTDDGLTLMGDLVGVPKWFADIMESAYPARSIEGGAWHNDANQKSWDFGLEAVVLLGVVWPGCTSLADLQELFSDEGPEVTVIEMKRGGGQMAKVRAQVNVEDVRRAFYEEVAQGDRFWWWDRAMLIDPDELIVQDPDAGQLYRLPFSVKGDEVEFADPVPVKIVYEDQPEKQQDDEPAKARVNFAMVPNAGTVIASNSNRAEAQSGFRSTNEEATLDPKKIRERLGLAEDASDSEVEAKLNELVEAEHEETPAPAAGEPEPEETPAPVAGEPEPEETPAPAAGVRQLDEETYQRLLRGAQTAETLSAEKAQTKRDSKINAAIKAGKFPPSRKAHWTKLWDADPTGTEEIIDALAAGVVPVSEMGSAYTSESGGDAGPAYDDSALSPSEKARIKAAREGSDHPRVMIGKD